MAEFVKKSVTQTVKYNYNTNNTAAMKTFDMIHEGVSTNDRHMPSNDGMIHFLSSLSVVGLMEWTAGTRPTSMNMISKLRS